MHIYTQIKLKYCRDEGPDKDIGQQAAPEDIKQPKDKQVQTKVDRYWAEEEVRL